MGIDESMGREIVRRILSIAAPDKVILFGSAAEGRMTRDRDLDLLIVDPDPGNRRKEGVRFRQILRGLGYPANQYGKVIYEAA